MRLQRRCDAITRGSAIAATAPGGAYVTGAGGVPVPVTLHPAVTKAVGPPAAVTKKPKPKAKPKKLGRAETVAILRNSTKRVKRWEKGDESIPTKGKKGRAK